MIKNIDGMNMADIKMPKKTEEFMAIKPEQLKKEILEMKPKVEAKFQDLTLKQLRLIYLAFEIALDDTY